MRRKKKNYHRKKQKDGDWKNTLWKMGKKAYRETIGKRIGNYFKKNRRIRREKRRFYRLSPLAISF